MFFQDVCALCASLSGVQGVSEDVWGSRGKMFGWQCDRRLFEAGRKMSRWAPSAPMKNPIGLTQRWWRKKTPDDLKACRQHCTSPQSSMLNGITMWYIYILYILDGLFETSASNCRRQQFGGKLVHFRWAVPWFLCLERHLTIIHPVTYMIFICTLCISHG